MVGNPEDRFSDDTAQLLLSISTDLQVPYKETFIFCHVSIITALKPIYSCQTEVRGKVGIQFELRHKRPVCTCI